ncbi:MAG: hypothetical protein N3A01_09625, partial [Bacteroidales bacterium]|nr:hypothetical protein [Bacteroidales bacterium]
MSFPISETPLLSRPLIPSASLSHCPLSLYSKVVSHLYISVGIAPHLYLTRDPCSHQISITLSLCRCDACSLITASALLLSLIHI